MTAEIIPFDFDDTAVRIVMRDGTPWFVASDVCRVLDIGNHRDALSRLDDDEKDGVGITDAIGREQKTSVVSESGLFALVLTSRKPEARKFRKWITSEVLPALRTTGEYKFNQNSASQQILPQSQRDAEIWLSMVREARLIGGSQAGRKIWLQSPLPPIFGQTLCEQGDPKELQDLLTGWLQVILDGATTADEVNIILAQHHSRMRDGRLFVPNIGLPCFTGTRFLGTHRSIVSRIQGAEISQFPLTINGVRVRGTWVPIKDDNNV